MIVTEGERLNRLEHDRKIPVASNESPVELHPIMSICHTYLGPLCSSSEIHAMCNQIGRLHFSFHVGSKADRENEANRFIYQLTQQLYPAGGYIDSKGDAYDMDDLCLLYDYQKDHYSYTMR